MPAPWVLPEELRQLAEADESLVQEVLAVFRSDTADRISRLRVALHGGDYRAVKHEAHALKGSAGQVGANEVFTLSREMEQQAGAANPAGLPELLVRLQAAFDQVSREMSA
jgi:HPt (histidine-containing phosphotransfer) domain-containing protein